MEQTAGSQACIWRRHCGRLLTALPGFVWVTLVAAIRDGNAIERPASWTAVGATGEPRAELLSRLAEGHPQGLALTAA